MKKYRNSQSGFSAVEAMLIIVIVAAIVGAGWYVWHSRQHTSPPNASSTSKKTTAASASSEDSGWKTFDWKAEGLTFKYPANWVSENPQLSASEQSNQPVLTPSSPIVYLFSPTITTIKGFAGADGPSELSNYSGSFAINAQKDTAANIESSSFASNTLPGVPNDPTAESIVKVIPVVIPGYGAMSIVEESEYGYVTQLALTDAPVTTGVTKSTAGDGYPSMSPDDSFQSKSDPSDRISFAIGFFGEDKVNAPLTFGYDSMQRSTFENQPDYQTALDILKSVSY